ncbi:hypothetical protein CIB95_13745 [Lottiidibacillus patelloidae]|uniref:Lysine transporter LysE n=2 Tax=Lottiidibacillus patelloidae TaxID=2670334 RepID=A0A263BRJ8_9BACI|nr:hypothetical protein CIB95_13745 [Lottiidibacillus patelloidae]
MIKRGITDGFWQSWLVGLGGVTADFLFLILIFFGASQFMQHKVVVLAMYAIGAIMLMYLGISSMKSSIKRIKVMSNLAEEHVRISNAYLTGFFIALVNPINIVFWFGVYGSTLATLSKKETLATSVLLSMAIFIGIILWNLNIAFTVHFGRELVKDRLLRMITFVAGFCLFWFGVGFAIEFIRATL